MQIGENVFTKVTKSDKNVKKKRENSPGRSVLSF